VIPTGHPPRAALDQLLAGDINDRQLQRWVIAHLLRRCDVCESYLRREAHPDLVAATEAFARAADGILAAGLGRAAGGTAAIRRRGMERPEGPRRRQRGVEQSSWAQRWTRSRG
jgi:hypothetical protein